MARLLRFTVVSAFYCVDGGRLPRGGTFTLTSDDPMVETYKEDGCLKMEVVPEGTPKVEVEEIVDLLDGDDINLEDISDEFVPVKFKNILLEAGYRTAQGIIEAGQDRLTELKGIAEKSAADILEGCSFAIDDVNENDEDEEDDD